MWRLLFYLTFSLSLFSKELTPSEKLSQAEWKHRVIVVHDPLKNRQWLQLLKKFKSEFEERHLIVIKADSVLKTRYQIDPKQFTLVLIGKDGGEKMRQVDEPKLKGFFKRIDQMPMRRREMKKNKER